MNKVYKFFLGILALCLLLFVGQKKLNEKAKDQDSKNIYLNELQVNGAHDG